MNLWDCGKVSYVFTNPTSSSFSHTPMHFQACCAVVCVHAFSVTQSCPVLCKPMNCSLSGSSLMGFPSQEYWSGLPFPSPGDFPDPGIKPESPALAGGLYRVTWEDCCVVRWRHITEFWPIDVGRSDVCHF